MVLIETKTCENALDARREERKHIEDLNALLNMSIPARTIGEYLTANHTQIREKAKNYRATHQTQII